MPRWIRVLLPLLLAVGFASVLLVDYGYCAAQSAEPELRPGQEFLRVNELMASNKKTLVDPNETGQTPDWIEIYNASSEPVSLDGLALADGEPLDGGFPITNGLVISPGGFMLFYADGDTKQGPHHTNFKLNGDNGESVILYEFAARQEIHRVNFPPLSDDISFGFKPDGSGEPKILEVATPGISNSSNPPHISNVTPPPYPAPVGAAVTISATVTDSAMTASATPHATDNLTVTLYYSTTLTTSYQALPMAVVGPDTYETQIPAQAADILVSYYVQAVDGNSEISRLPLPAREARYLTGYVAPHLIINEIVVENSSLRVDTDEPAETPDWIELINPGADPVPLSGLSITDDKYRPLRNPLTDVPPLGAGQRLTLLADDDVGQNSLHPGTGPYHLKFALEKTGGFVGVYGGQGTVLIDSYQYNDAPVWGVFGRFPDGLDAESAWSSMLCATYDAPNLLCDKIIFLPVLRR